jgi:uncharacterized RmlC-like cupin family protein
MKTHVASIVLAAMVLCLSGGAVADEPVAPGKEAAVGKVVRGAGTTESKQGALYAPGISAETVGSKSLFLGMVSVPPGGRTKAHVHEHHETAFYFLSGEEVELWTGQELQHLEVARPGDYMFIPRNVPHVAVNRSRTVPAVFIGARNEATAQESVIMHPELDAKVPQR